MLDQTRIEPEFDPILENTTQPRQTRTNHGNVKQKLMASVLCTLPNSRRHVTRVFMGAHLAVGHWPIAHSPPLTTSTSMGASKKCSKNAHNLPPKSCANRIKEKRGPSGTRTRDRPRSTPSTATPRDPKRMKLEHFP